MNHSSGVRMLSIVLISIQLMGCSTMFGRQSDEDSVSFDSNVLNVEVMCSGKRAMTPGSIPLRHSQNHACTAAHEGYEKKIFRIRSGTSWAGFGHSTALNTAIWGWWTLGIGTGIGWLIDFSSGAMKNLKDENLYLEMQPAKNNSAVAKTAEEKLSLGRTLDENSKEIQAAANGALDTTVQGNVQRLVSASKPELRAVEKISAPGKPKKI